MPERPASDWTIETLMVHLTAKIDSLEKIINAKLSAQERSVEAAFSSTKAALEQSETTQERYRSMQNEWRGSLSDLSSTMLPRDEYNRAHETLVDKIAGLSKRIDIQEGRESGVGNTLSYISSAIALILSVLGGISIWIHWK